MEYGEAEVGFVAASFGTCKVPKLMLAELSQFPNGIASTCCMKYVRAYKEREERKEEI